VDYALLARKRGCSLKQSVIEAGTTRLRPILMTSLSTVAGMVPIVLELGAGGEVRSPMAIAVIGGFSTATLLTLIVVPVCFIYIARLQEFLSRSGQWIRRLFNRSQAMPGLNGFKVCPQLRRIALFRTTPILLLAPKVTLRTRLKGKWCGASDHLARPLDRTQLLTKLFLLMI